jgi:hypothetical protein
MVAVQGSRRGSGEPRPSRARRIGAPALIALTVAGCSSSLGARSPTSATVSPTTSGVSRTVASQPCGAPPAIPLPPGLTEASSAPTRAGVGPAPGGARPVTRPVLAEGGPEGDPGPATRLAKDVLGRAILPPQAVPATSVPAALTMASTTPATPNLVDLDRLWRVELPLQEAIAFVAGHPPMGMVCTGSGSSGGPGGVSTEEVTFDLISRPAGIASAQLQVAVAPVGTTSSTIRVDAQVVFSPRRTDEQKVPASDAVVVVTRSGFLASGAPAAGSETRTDPPTVQRLASILDRLPAAVPGASSCPSFSLGYQLAFAAHPGAPPDYVAITRPCDQVIVKVGGVTVQPALSDIDGALTQAVAPLFSADSQATTG